MAAKARTLFLPFAALCLPVLANVSRATVVAEKPHPGVRGLVLASNLLTRTDARGAVVTMSYNARNQVTSKTYTGTAAGLTPAVSYGYDACTYGAGRLCSVSNSVATKAFAYDALGRVTANSQTMTGASPYTFSYNYYAGDGLREVTYPAIGAQAGRKIGYDYYASGRLKGVWDGAVESAQRWVQGDIAYWPSGAPKTTTLGNGVVEGTELDERLRQNVRTAGKAGVNLMALTVAYELNGNVSSEKRQSTAPGQVISTTTYYSYDGVNRLTNALPDGSAWSESYGYDRWGNRWVSTNSGYSLLFMVPTAGTQFGATNRLVKQYNGVDLPGTPYDDAGNLISHPAMGTMTYDGENRLVAATSGTPSRTSSYEYDGDGKRVKRTVGADTTVYVYDAFGALAAEAGAASAAATKYLTVDHLGSTRLVTDAAGAVAKCYDYMPFGEPLTMGRPSCFSADGYQQYPAGDKQSVRFTGKERDAETGLDYFGARYFSGAMGRFTSPDPVNHPTGSKNPTAFLMNPQRWNAYAYVSNNPLRLVDPDGREEEESVLGMVQRYLGAMFQPASSIGDLTSTRESTGSTSGPWMNDHEMATRFTQELGNNLNKLADVYTAADPTGVSSIARSAMTKDGAGVAMATIGAMIPGGRSGGNIALSEAKQLVGGWSKGTFEKVGASIGYHFEKHGGEVGAGTVWQYLRKAEGFAKNLKGAAKTSLDGGATRYTKNGKYVILDENKKILSYGTVD